MTVCSSEKSACRYDFQQSFNTSVGFNYFELKTFKEKALHKYNKKRNRI